MLEYEFKLYGLESEASLDPIESVTLNLKQGLDVNTYKSILHFLELNSSNTKLAPYCNMSVSAGGGLRYPIQSSMGRELLSKPGEITIFPNAIHYGQNHRIKIETDAVGGLVEMLTQDGVLVEESLTSV